MLCKIVLPSNEIFKLPSLPKSYEELFTAVRIRLQQSSSANFTMKYKDSDSELISLNNDEDLQTAILTHQMDQISTLRVIILFKEDSTISSSSVKQSTGSIKLVQALEKTKIESQVTLTQSQAFDKLKNISMETSKAVRGPSQSTLDGDQLEAISGFIGLRVKEMMDMNMKEFIPSLVSKFQDNRNNLENVNKSRVSENGLERAKNQMEAPYYTPAPRKINWFGDFCCAECICSECSKQIRQVKYMCLDCPNYKCCQECENKAEHSHPLLKLRANQGTQRNANNTPLLNKNSMFISRQSLTKSTCEKKISYCGRIILENSTEKIIKTYPSQEHQMTIAVENIGKEAWPKDVRLLCVNGNYRNRQEELIPLIPGTKQILHLNITAPTQTGRYLSQWKLYYNDEEKVRSFGESLFIEMQVEDKRLQYSRSNEVNGTGKDANEKRKNLTLRRGNTFSDVYSNRIEEKRREEQAQFFDKKKAVAAYLNEVFPGCLEEKYGFLENCESNADLEDLTKIVELYMRSLGHERREKTYRSTEGHDNRELLSPLS